MALDYKGSVNRYRKYLQTVRNEPVWQASFFVILSLVLVMVMLVWALRPTLVTIGGLVGQIEQQRKISDQLNQKINSVQRAATELETIRPRLTLLEEAAPKQPNWEMWVKQVEGLATQSGVSIETMVVNSANIKGKMPVAAEKSVKPAEENLAGGAKGVGFAITARGTYEQLSDFAFQLEKRRRLVDYTNVRFARSDSGELSVNINGTVVYIPEATK